ncbi:pyridoxal phosphate-dependent aminotransferase family protein [Mucilaginibacter puniceus]
MSSAKTYIEKKLAERQASGAYRTLKPENNLVDLCSNDYLGFARSINLKNTTDKEILRYHQVLNGSTGSRLISGNLAYTEDLEKQIAAYHNSEAGLIFNSGYDANLGLFSSLPQRGDTIITDELIHASIIDGTRLSYANRYTFRHNDLASLEAKLMQAKGICYVAVESIYSMDGDTPSLLDIITLTEKYNAHLIVDEAHAVGLYKHGLINRLNLQERVFARVVTFGKALGCHGAIVLGSNLLREYLINFSRSFIYTTAAPFHQLASVKMAYELLKHSDKVIEQLKSNISLFKILIANNVELIGSDSSIQCILLKSNEKARGMAAELQNKGLDVRAILSPTVPQGLERIRICLHAYNTAEEIALLASTINQYHNG